ncbi:zinc transporter ZIP2-like [Saccostrea cucullata]|uniref:zinc transporter ZIP2-like n=1 Tax=Saccostrea cuccullata TaxID=36930 RepID=UPI002ED4F84B
MSPQEVDMDVVVAKIISLIISTGVSVLFGLTPCKLYQHFAKEITRIRKAVDYSISSMKCFSGGVFLGTCFLHLIPETRNKIEAVMTQSRSYSQYPVAELLTVVGFFGVLFMEHAIRSLYRKLQRLTDRDREYGEGDMFTFSSCRFAGSESDLDEQSMNSINMQDTLQAEHNTFIKSAEQEETKEAQESDIEPAPLQDLPVKTVVSELSRGDDSGKGQMRSAIFITALSFHGVFEGMTLGLQSMESNVWVLCFAITIHRGILAFGMGLDHMRNDVKHRTMIFSVSSFSVLAAVGIIIGIAISTGAQLYEDVLLPDAILQSLATGTLFYIIFFDILYKELNGNKEVKKLSCVFVGFSVMAIIFAVTRR